MRCTEMLLCPFSSQHGDPPFVRDCKCLPPGSRRECRAPCHAGAQKRPLLSSGHPFSDEEPHGSGDQALMCSPALGSRDGCGSTGSTPGKSLRLAELGGLDGARGLSQEWVFPLSFCYTAMPGQRRLLDPKSGKRGVAPVPSAVIFRSRKSKDVQEGLKADPDIFLAPVFFLHILAKLVPALKRQRLLFLPLVSQLLQALSMGSEHRLSPGSTQRASMLTVQSCAGWTQALWHPQSPWWAAPGHSSPPAPQGGSARPHTGCQREGLGWAVLLLSRALLHPSTPPAHLRQIWFCFFTSCLVIYKLGQLVDRRNALLLSSRGMALPDTPSR